MLSSIQESFEKQMQEQGETIRSSENRNYLIYLKWKDTVENDLFRRILNASYVLYSVYDYETIIKIYIRFNSVPNCDIPILGIYSSYFDEKKNTLTSEGLENLIKEIGKC